jgi:hypothetical protein
VLQNGGDVGRCGGGDEMVSEYYSMIRKWSEVLRRRMRWRSCYDKSCVDGV